MKRFALTISAVTMIGSISFAADPAPAAKHTNACQQIVDACSKAGFTFGKAKTPKGKNLYKDCVQPIMAGKTVTGVSVSPETVEMCRISHRKGS